MSTKNTTLAYPITVTRAVKLSNGDSLSERKLLYGSGLSDDNSPAAIVSQLQINNDMEYAIQREIANRREAVAKETANRMTADESLQNTIASLSKLSEGSTTGDAELIAARTGADGVTYSNLQTALNTQFTNLKTEIHEIDCVEVSDTEPTDENVVVWVDTSITDEHVIPEVKDSEISNVDTWSSEKISTELDNLKGQINGEFTKIHLTDQITGKVYELFMYGGKLAMEEVIE